MRWIGARKKKTTNKKDWKGHCKQSHGPAMPVILLCISDGIKNNIFLKNLLPTQLDEFDDIRDACKISTSTCMKKWKQIYKLIEINENK